MKVDLLMFSRYFGSYMIRMKITKTVLKCKNCDPNHELDKLNPRWSSGKKAEYYKGFVGIYSTEKSPIDYNEKLDNLICPFCNGKLIDTNFSHDDFRLIGKVTDYNRTVLDLMMELHEKDLIEYQLKLSQFKIQQEQSDAIREQERESNKPHCPTCNSTDLKKISALSKVGSVAMFGFLSSKVKKQFHCNKCGYEW